MTLETVKDIWAIFGILGICWAILILFPNPFHKHFGKKPYDAITTIMTIAVILFIAGLLAIHAFVLK